ncbi:MAG TPA: gas vesicle protein K [Verrucomicrobiae bacterium]|nr:gas vesicle protein K [Verrucomicrobiae bacterium]
MNRELKAVGEGGLERIECSPESVEQGLARLVLTLVELLRRLMERQAIRRMEGGTLEDGKVEELGQALMRLEAKVHEIAGAFGLRPEDLNLELGPLGNLLDQ